MTFNFLGPGLTVNVEAKVKEQIILDSSDKLHKNNELNFRPEERQKGCDSRWNHSLFK